MFMCDSSKACRESFVFYNLDRQATRSSKLLLHYSLWINHKILRISGVRCTASNERISVNINIEWYWRNPKWRFWDRFSRIYCKEEDRRKNNWERSESLFHIINPLNPELNPICYLLALLGAHHFFHVSRLRVKLLTFRLLMSYIYMEHPFLMFLDHTQRRSTVGRTPLD